MPKKRKDRIRRLPASGIGGLAVQIALESKEMTIQYLQSRVEEIEPLQTALAAKQQEIENLTSRLEQIQPLDDLIRVRVEQSGSIEELKHLDNSLRNGLSQVQKWGMRFKENTPQHFEPFQPVLTTNEAETFPPMPMSTDNQFPPMTPAMDDWYLQNLHQKQQLQAQSNVGQRVQREEECVVDVGQASGATIGESSPSTSNPQYSFADLHIWEKSS